MFQRLTFLLTCCLILLSSLWAQQPQPPSTSLPFPYAPTWFIMRVADDAPLSFNMENGRFGEASLDALAEQHQVTHMHPLIKSRDLQLNTKREARDRLLIVHTAHALDMAVVAEAWASNEWVVYAEPDFVGQGAGTQSYVPDDNWFGRQWGMVNDGSFNADAEAGADIDMDRAWDIAQGDATIVAMTLDSGAKLDHPEFAGRIWNNAADQTVNSNDDDNNGYIDDSVGWDFANDDNDPTDDHGHGTNVMGILGATGDNGIGYAGVDWNCQLMVGKVLNDENWGFYSWWTAGIYYAVDNGADVINMSMGGESFSSSMLEAAEYAHNNDVPIVVSMMNFNNGTPYYPAAYPTTIAVGATDTDDQRVNPFFWDPESGSCYGAHNDLVAPGNFMYGLSHTNNVNYNTYWGGTSQAAPLVAGVASLMKGMAPNLSSDSIRYILQFTSEDEVGLGSEDTPGFDQYHGAGRLNAFEALNFVANQLATSTRPDFSASQWTVYPQPAGAGQAIQMRITVQQPQQRTLYIHNTLGQLMSTYPLLLQAKQTEEIEIEGLARGIYIATLEGSGTAPQYRKLWIE